MPNRPYDSDAFSKLRDASYEAGGAIAWPVAPDEPPADEPDDSTFSFLKPVAFANYEAGDVVEASWAASGSVEGRTVEVFVVAAEPDGGTAPGARVRAVAWAHSVSSETIAWTVPKDLPGGVYRFRAYPTAAPESSSPRISLFAEYPRRRIAAAESRAGPILSR